MFSLRSKPASARIAFAATLLLAICALLAAIPALAAAAPEGDEGPPPPAPAPQLSFEPGSYDFGLQEANRSNAEATIQLRNVGAVAAPIFSVDIVGADSWAFSNDGGSCFSHALEPGESCAVRVYFHPQDAVPYAAQLRASSEAGTSFTADLEGEGGRAILTPAADPTNFGSVPVGAGAVIRTIDVTNKGNMPGGAFIAVISGGAVGSFHLLDENCTGFMLSPAATCNLLVGFEPIGTGAKTARLFLVGDGDGGTQIALTGIGLDPGLAAEPGPSAAGGAAAAKPHHRYGSRGKAQRRRDLRRRRQALSGRWRIG